MSFEDDELNEARNSQDSTEHIKRTLFNSLFLAVCRPFNSHEVSVEPTTPSQQREYYKYEQIGPTGMSLLTENFLRGNLIKNLSTTSPRSILDEVETFYNISHDSVYILIAADICLFFARRTENKTKIRFYLSACRYCFLAFRAQKEQQDPETKISVHCQFLQELQIFNEAVAGIFAYLKTNNLLDSDMFTLQGVDGTEFVFEKPKYLLSVPRAAVSDFSLCSDYSVKALRLINRHSGFGVPLVAKITAPNLSNVLCTPTGLTIPVTFFFLMKRISDHKYSLFPNYQDTSIRETFEIEEESPEKGIWMLARDFTTPLACFMNALTQRNLLSGMLRSDRYDTLTGLYMVEPYHPEKIPVIFVHGLMSGPETWGQMINSLKYDPKIRQKYQFWFFLYPTGVPVLYSAANLRKALLAAQKEFCTTPESTRNFEQMVLVGHSMGGLISRVLLQKNPYQLLEYFSKKPWQESKKVLKPEDWKLLEKLVILHPLPFVRRVVFMAVPHRGASMAQRGLAKLGINLIHLPQMILEKKNDFKRIIELIMPDSKISWKENSFITGIENLNPEGYFVQWFSDSPMLEDVIYHSIIGNKKAAAVPGGSDGIVPYKSSHLNGIASECIVKSDHSVHRRPEAIRELMRILLLHLQ